MIFNQQQYMGASIRSFNASIGWGGTPSTLDVQLVADTTRLAADNGFKGESFNPTQVGLPTVFHFSGYNNDDLTLPTGQFIDWSFAGIVKNYRQDNSSTGSPLFSVSVSDPREILGGSQLILDDYFGSVSGIPNMLNVFGAVEDIMQLNTANGNYGGMQRNETGTPWWIIRDGIHYLTSGVLSQHYGSFLKLKDRKYTVNLSDFPQNLSSGYRVPAVDNMSVLDYIDDVCQAASHDYYVTLNPLYYDNGKPILDENLYQINEIKVNTVSRAYLPEPSSIIRFIANTTGASVKNIGVELRNQTNAKFLLGGNIQTMYATYDSGWMEKNGLSYELDNIHQFYGVGSNGNLLPESRPSPDNYIAKNKKADPIIIIDTRNLDSRVYNYPFYLTNIEELKACLSSIEAWKDYLIQTEMYKYVPINEDDIAWLDSKNIPIYTGVLSRYFGPFKNGEINRRNYIPVYHKFTPLIAGTELFPNNVKYLTKNGDNFDSFWIEFEPSHFKNTPGNQPPSPNLNLLDDNVNIINNNLYSHIGISKIEDVNGIKYKYEEVGFVMPLDKDGYSHAINFQRKEKPIFSNGNRQTWVRVLDFNENRHPQYVTYKHTKVPNIHYKKYHHLLNLSCGTNQEKIIDILALLNTASTINDIATKNMLLSQCQTTLAESDLDIIKQEEDNMRIQGFYDFLYQYAKNIGTKYMVKMPNILITHNSTNSGIITSMSPVNEGYLTEEEYLSAASIGLLPKNYFNLTTDNTMLQPYAFYPSAYLYELSSISENDIAYSYQPDGSRKDAYIKCSIDEEVFFVDRYVEASAAYPKAVITLPQIINYKEDYDKKASIGTKYFLNNLGEAISTKNYSNVVGADDLFEFGIPEPIQPMFVAIPLRNNISSYGPWYNVGATGIIEYERDESLVPWNYGGYSGLNEAAYSKISEVAIQQQDENGSIEFPGMPSISLGQQLEWMSNGSKYYGPYITDIAVDFGDGGIKTNYKMQTWTPKFGKLAKQFEDSLRKTGEQAQKAQRISLHNENSGFNQKTRRVLELYDILKNNSSLEIKKSLSKSMRYSSSHQILAGQTEGLIQSGIEIFNTKVVNQPSYNTVTQVSEDYPNKAFVSLDAVFRPYSTYSLHSGYLPHFETINSGLSDFALDSFVTAANMTPFPYGHDINVFTMDEQIPRNGLLNNNNYSNDNNYRGLGFKTPIVMVGYGKDINGKPVPNANSYMYDDSGRYVYNPSGNECSDYYANNYLNRTDMWKAGPLDTRWDGRKKMWVPGSLLVEGYMIEDLAAAEGRFSDIPFTSGRMVLCAGTYANIESGYQPKLWDRADASGYYSSGLLNTGQSGLLWHSSGEYYSNLAGIEASGGNPNLFVLLINRSTQISAPSGTYVIASPMPNGDYRPIWVDCEPSERDGIE